MFYETSSTDSIHHGIKYLQADGELCKEIEQWNDMLRTEVVKLCQDNSFNTGFFEGIDNSIAVDAYELKVVLTCPSFKQLTIHRSNGK